MTHLCTISNRIQNMRVFHNFPLPDRAAWHQVHLYISIEIFIAWIKNNNPLIRFHIIQEAFTIVLKNWIFSLLFASSHSFSLSLPLLFYVFPIYQSVHFSFLGIMCILPFKPESLPTNVINLHQTIWTFSNIPSIANIMQGFLIYLLTLIDKHKDNEFFKSTIR